jgi:hypothetical protein
MCAQGGPRLPPAEPQRPVPLPPPPMATVGVVRAPDLPLPWATPLVALVFAAAMAATAVGLMIAANHDTDGWEQVTLTILWYAVALSLGAVIADHVWPARRRSYRWSLGMGLAALIPDPALVLDRPTGGAALVYLLAVWVSVSALVAALLGLAMGAVGNPARGFAWRLVGTGAAAGILIMASFIGIDIVTQLARGHFYGWNAYLSRELGVVGALFSAYFGSLGLALALGVYLAAGRARRRAGGR